MKNNKRTIATACAAFFILCVAYALQAGDAVWTASSGLLPSGANPRWGFFEYPQNGAHPALEADGLRLRSTNGYIGFYQGDGEPNVLDIPTNLVLEARVRAISGTAAIYFVTEQGVENWLSIGTDEIFVHAGARTNRGATAHVDTDNAFHNYRIEVRGVTNGSLFQVFYDGALTLTGSLYFEDEDQRTEILWGSYPSGESLWQSFRHNAFTTPTLTAFPAAEICWPSRSNLFYQVQWASSLPATGWTGLGPPIRGTGAEICVFDSTRGAARRFYRVEVVP